MTFTASVWSADSIAAAVAILVRQLHVPYTVALVKLEEGPMVTAQLTDLGESKPEIGMPVEMVTRKLRQDGDERGMIVYGYKFRPLGQVGLSCRNT